MLSSFLYMSRKVESDELGRPIAINIVAESLITGVLSLGIPPCSVSLEFTDEIRVYKLRFF